MDSHLDKKSRTNSKESNLINDNNIVINSHSLETEEQISQNSLGPTNPRKKHYAADITEDDLDELNFLLQEDIILKQPDAPQNKNKHSSSIEEETPYKSAPAIQGHHQIYDNHPNQGALSLRADAVYGDISTSSIKEKLSTSELMKELANAALNRGTPRASSLKTNILRTERWHWWLHTKIIWVHQVL